MAYTARKVEYFYTTVMSGGAEAFDLLDNLAGLGVNFVALNMVPLGPDSMQLTLFPEDSSQLQAVAKQTGLQLQGPHPAVLVQGDDEAGALASMHKELRDENVDVFASTGVTDGRGRYGCVLYLRPADADRAVRVLAR